MAKLGWILGFGGLGLLVLGRKGFMNNNFPPVPKASDWVGWVWPVPIWQGRVPVTSQEYKPGPREQKGVHLGNDIMFPKRAGDPPGRVRHDASPGHIAPEGTPIIAAGPGRIWGTYNTSYGLSILIDHGAVGDAGGVTTFYQHLASFAKPWRKGDEVRAGDLLGTMGFDPTHDSQQLRHLHFELNFPRATVPHGQWPQDPAPYMRFWRKIEVA